MPALIKNQGQNSPGIITFSSGEALWGLPRLSNEVREFLNFQSQSGNWIFGVHVQGDLSSLDQWPLESWLGFVLWPDPKARFLSNIAESKRLPLACVNFMPAGLAKATARIRVWDICLISRASSIKRIDDSLEIIRILIIKNPAIQIVIIVPDGRTINSSQEVMDNSYFKLPRHIFTSNQLKNLTFISSSTEAFGQFPLSDTFMSEIILQSKFVMLNSHSEGTPRSLAEALLLGTPVIVSENLRSGINNALDDANSIKVSDNNLLAAEQILHSLLTYDSFIVNRQQSEQFFSESVHLPIFKNLITNLYPQIGEHDGLWHLHELHLRLACHGQKVNQQFFNNSNAFFKWFNHVERINNSNLTLDDDDLLYSDVYEDYPLPLKSFHRFLVLGISKFLRIIRSIRRNW